MAELGRIDPIKRMQCPECRALLPDWTTEEAVAGELQCPSCSRPVKLPDEVVERARRSRYLGKNLDITG